MYTGLDQRAIDPSIAGAARRSDCRQPDGENNWVVPSARKTACRRIRQNRSGPRSCPLVRARPRDPGRSGCARGCHRRWARARRRRRSRRSCCWSPGGGNHPGALRAGPRRVESETSVIKRIREPRPLLVDPQPGSPERARCNLRVFQKRRTEQFGLVGTAPVIHIHGVADLAPGQRCPLFLADRRGRRGGGRSGRPLFLDVLLVFCCMCHDHSSPWPSVSSAPRSSSDWHRNRQRGHIISKSP